MKPSKKHIDQKIKEKVDNYEFDFSDHAWDKMEQLMDHPAPPTRSNHLFTFRNFTIMILLLIILYLGVDTLIPENIKLSNADLDPTTTEYPETKPTDAIPESTLNLEESITEPNTDTEAISDTPSSITKKKAAQASQTTTTPPPLDLPVTIKNGDLKTGSQTADPMRAAPSTTVEPDSGQQTIVPAPEPPTKELAFFQKLQQQLEAYNEHYRPEKVYLQFDRSLFRPGESIWFNAFLRDANSLKASQNSEIVYVELNGPNGANLRTLNLVAKNGQSHGDFLLPEDAVGGQYTIKAFTNWQKNQQQFFERKIQVQNVVLPKLRMELDFVREAYGPGDEVEAKLDLKGLDNKVLSKQQFGFAALLEGQLLNSSKGKTDKDGKATLRFKLPSDLETNDGLLNVVIEYKGQNESIARSIPIVLNKIDLQFLPEGGEMLSGFPAKVAFKALNEFGQPADVEGIIFDSKGEEVTRFRSYHQGMGAFQFEPQKGEHYYARIDRPQNIQEDYTLPRAMERGYGLQVGKAENGLLNLEIHTTESEELYLIAHTRGQIYQSRSIQAEAGSQTIALPIDNLPIGIAQFTLFDHKEIPRAERLAFLHPDRTLDIQIQTDKERYQPREKVKLTVEVKDDRGIPMPGQFALSVASDNLLTFADDKQGNILAYLLLESDLQGKVVAPNFYFDHPEKHPNKDQLLALDYLMLTQGWRRFSWETMQQTPLMAMKYQAERATVSGIVLDEARRPVANALLKVKGGAEQVYSRDDGSFALENLNFYDGNVMVLVSKNGRDRSFEVSRYQEGRRIQLAKGSREPYEVLDISGTGDYFIKGKAVDSNGEPLIGATVLIKGTKTGAMVDLEGNFVIKYLPAGTYELEVNYTGYSSKTIVCQTENLENFVGDVVLDEGVSLSEVVVTEYKVPLIEQDNTTSGAMITSTKVKTLPTRDITTIAATTAGLVSADDGDQITIRGSRTDAVTYYIDGVRVSSSLESQAVGGKGKDRLVKNKNAMSWENAKRQAQSNAIEEVEEMFTEESVEINAEHLYALNFRKGYYRTRQFYYPKYEDKAAKRVTVRNDFRSTIYWNPEVNIGRDGRAALEFYTSDEMTTFRASLEGLAVDGGIGRKDHFFYSQLPFGMEVKLPHRIMNGDVLTLPLTLSNNTAETIEGQLQVNMPAALQLEKKMATRQKLAAGESKTIYLPLRVASNQQLDAVFDILFEAEGYNDAFNQTVEIVPRGFPVEAVYSGAEQEQVFSIALNDPIEGSVSANFQVYPDLSNDLMAGMERMLRQPSGCFEQTSSSNYPNVLVLDYLKSSNRLNKEVRRRALKYLRKGYHRLTGFEVKGGGFDWYGKAPANEALTAYGLLQFVDMKAVYPVDSEMIERNAKWLLSRRDGKGSWHMNERSLHRWDRNNPIADAYIVWALCEAGMAHELTQEINKSFDDALESKDPYILALMANALYAAKDKRAAQLMKILLPLQAKDGHWKGLRYSMTRSGGQGLKIETTALTALAILKDKLGLDQLEKAMSFIHAAKSPYGFGSTQSTVLAMKALVASAKFNKKQWNDGEFQLHINGKKVAKESFKNDLKETINIANLGDYLRAGNNEVKVKFSKKGAHLPYDFRLRYHKRQPNDSKQCKLAMTTQLATTKAKMGDNIRLTTTLRNTTEEAIPNTIAKVGIPAGLSVQAWQLQEMQEKGLFDFYELFDGYLVFHYRGLAAAAEKVIPLDLKADLPGTYEAPASVAYLYYTNEDQVWSKPERVEVEH